VKPITEAKFLTDEERAKLNATLNRDPTDRNALLLQLILLTGARGKEALSLTPKDFAWSEGTVNITAAKKSDNRTIPLPVEFCRRIKAYTDNLKADELIFPIETRQLRYIWDYYRPVKKGVHCLRHTAGILLYINCRDINVVRVYLGHRNIQSTLVYLNFVEGARKLRQAMKGMWSQKVLD
jgi:integrase